MRAAPDGHREEGSRLRFLVFCSVGVLLAACSGLSGQPPLSRAPTRAQPSPTIEGTTWTWSDGRSVQFLHGGRVRFSNYVYGGNWQQHGNSVTFDQNGVMLFEVVISGNVMSGTWRQLKGDDTHSTFPTALRKTA
jgi:hypothetical protein